MTIGYALGQIPDLLLFLYDSYRKFFHGETVSKKNDATRIDVAIQTTDVTCYEEIAKQFRHNTQRKNRTSEFSN